MRPLELWAGPECTVNRVGDEVRDQLEETGFAARLDDLDRLAGLGVRRVRLPLLWERAVSHVDGPADWRWADERVARLDELGLPCIAGLVHHGSGPRGTDLLDPSFATGLARHAGEVARRYPQLDHYTPVNEPLTTARFSGLYGLWYPHRRDDRAFVRALLNQIRATGLAMEAIRAVNPQARLVQTDDLGFAFAAPALQYQADFDNERRWLGFDLLGGRVDAQHPMWPYLRQHGAGQDELEALVERPCTPDLIGINCYVTSERFLDDRLELYPPSTHGGNGRDRYVDIESVRVLGPAAGGVQERLREAWERYGLPVALTEVHLGCSREEQMRWLHQAWRAAQSLRGSGVDVRAVTAWAAFGTYDWDSLVTLRLGRYESGLWDVRGATPRPTALARLARELARGEPASHPVLAGRGWWQRGIRHLVSPHGEPQAMPTAGRPVLITGARGTLARAFAHLCQLRGLPYRLLGRQHLDIADLKSIEAALLRWRPWAVINAAGFVDVDAAQAEPARQWRENTIGPAALAEVCSQHGVRLVSYSSDLVFDGAKQGDYVESDEPHPLNAYGAAKAEAERRVLARAPDALVIRTAAFFGPWDPHNFVTRGLAALRAGHRWQAAEDQVVSPTYVRDLVTASLDLLIDGESGLWHLANQGALSWADWARMVAQRSGLDAARVDALPARALGQKARRPDRVVLASERACLMPTLDNALSRYFAEVGPDVLPLEAQAPASEDDVTPLQVQPEALDEAGA
ncbi:sugar nucleotide-binding protein [Ideonella sp. YS5]|uniref:sugar nucleotide-binding protein n=1 Tax=Ideonella sp. YS5 TaxID=3453714 RepID=UPI003EEF7EBB